MKYPQMRTMVLCVALTLAAAGVSNPAHAQVRSIDGSGNNPFNPTWGSVDEQLLRQVPSAYDDGVSTPSGANRPSPREISNIVVAQPNLFQPAQGPTNMLWLWGQFIDHDVDLTDTQVDEGVCQEPFDISVPLGDPEFDPQGTGTQVIGLCRSIFDPATGTNPGNPRQQVNVITAFIDASNVYGSDTARVQALRKLDGSGELHTSPDPQSHRGLLPFNTFGLPNAALPGQDPEDLFVAGDVRVNENIALTAMHTLWMREHNFWARNIRGSNPQLSDEQIFQRARLIVWAEMQAITYREFLPVLLGPNALPRYSGYKPHVNPGISNIFSTASYRFGHSMLTSLLFRLDRQGNPIPAGHAALQSAFFAPQEILNAGGIDPLLRGAALQRANDVDPFIVDDVRNFLFGPPGAGGFDLASLNIQRGRDHGQPGYNDMRMAFGLPPKPDIASVTPDPIIRQRLQQAYTNVNDIDPWVGGLAEPPAYGGLVGETIGAVLRDQFLRLRNGDRFWYENVLRPRAIRFIERQTLARVLRRNTGLRSEIPNNVFVK